MYRLTLLFQCISVKTLKAAPEKMLSSTSTGHGPTSILVHPLHHYCQLRLLLAQVYRLIFSSSVGYLLYHPGRNRCSVCVLQAPYLCFSPAARVYGWKRIVFSQALPMEQGPSEQRQLIVTEQSSMEAASSCQCKTAVMWAAFWVKF